MTLTAIASILSPPSPLFAKVAVSNPAANKADSEAAPARTLTFQLVQSEIDLTWCLLNLANGLKANNSYRDAAEVIQRVKSALLNAESYAGDLKDPESSEASSSLQLLNDVVGTIAAIPSTNL
jgi:hypothetical protein